MIQLLGIIVFALLLYLGQKYVYAKIWQRDLKVSLSFPGGWHLGRTGERAVGDH